MIGRYVGFSIRYTILKYPLSVGYSDVTINNNLIGEEENFFTPYYAPDYMRVISLGYRLALMRGATV